MLTRSFFSVLAILAIAAALANCSGMQPLQEEGVHDNTSPPAELDSAAITITNTCLTETQLLVAFSLNGDSHYVSSALSAPEQEVGSRPLKIPAPFRILTTLQAEDWPATTAQCCPYGTIRRHRVALRLPALSRQPAPCRTPSPVRYTPLSRIPCHR